MSDQPIAMVCFDLGGVMIRLCKSWAHACEKAGVRVPAALSDASCMQHFRDTCIPNEIGITSQEDVCDVAGWLFGLDAGVVHEITSAYLDGKYEGIEDLIGELKLAGIKTACLSNTNDNHWQIMNGGEGENALPLDALDHRFASHLVRDRKPNPSFFRNVERETGLEAGQILFFDDALINVRAARRCGWQSEQVTDQEDPGGMMRRMLCEKGIL